MSGLVLKLAPRERVLINGAVIENGDRRGRLNILSRDVSILRLRDAIHPEERTTPVRRLCYAVQLVLTGDADLEEMRRTLERDIGQIGQVLSDATSSTTIAKALTALTEDKPYYVLKHLRSLLPHEAALLKDPV